MNPVRMSVLASLLGLSIGAAWAQPGGAGPGPGPGATGAGPAASAPGMGMGTGMGPGAARRGAHWGADYTPGWALMTEQERNEHRERMRSMQTYEACSTYREQHHAQMAARAKERGGPALPAPRRDACAGLKP